MASVPLPLNPVDESEAMPLGAVDAAAALPMVKLKLGGMEAAVYRVSCCPQLRCWNPNTQSKAPSCAPAVKYNGMMLLKRVKPEQHQHHAHTSQVSCD